jgi:ABC-type phosphate transport system substrate-binding protein
LLATFGLLLGALPAPSKPTSLTAINITGSTTVLPLAQSMAGNKYAIGYVGWAYLHPRITAMGVDVIAASPDAVRNRTYPLARDLRMFTAGEPHGAVKSFLEFALGPAGQGIVQAEGFVPVHQAAAALGTYQPKSWIATLSGYNSNDGAVR